MKVAGAFRQYNNSFSLSHRLEDQTVLSLMPDHYLHLVATLNPGSQPLSHRLLKNFCKYKKEAITLSHHHERCDQMKFSQYKALRILLGQLLMNKYQ